jgi:peptidoglycan/LPS O-acetylase OafA/YrhL
VATVLERPAPQVVRPAAGRSRIGGLDGLRAIAVAAVVTYHLGYDWLPGGFLGVDLFFVISGFLITTLLLAELEKRERIDLGAFYVRRAKRLLPALLLVLGVTLVLAATIANDVARQTVRDTPAALLYASNWWAIAQDQSYFELVGRGNLLAHLWSLAVEEQFYLVWPAILGGLCLVAPRLGLRRRALVRSVALGGALLSSTWMGVIAVGAGMPLEADPTRVYFGADTHASSVLLGAALATAWQVLRFRRAVVGGARTVLGVAGAAALVLTAWLMLTLSEFTEWLYRGGFLVVGAVFVVLVAAATHPASPLGPWLDVAPLRWVGERSYGIYLWHWPVFLVTRPGADVPWDGPLIDVLRVALVLGVAELSYRYVEVPVRQGVLGAWLARQRGAVLAVGVDAWLLATRRLAALAAAAVTLGALAGLLATAPTAEQVAASQGLGRTTEVVDSGRSRTQVRPVVAVAPKAASPSARAREVPAPYAGPLAEGVSPQDRPLEDGVRLTSADISWYGSSVDLWAVGTLRKVVPGVAIDAGVNRSPGFVEGRATRDLAARKLRKAVVLHLGDAGPVSVAVLDRTLSRLGTRVRVVLVNSTARFAFVAQGNRTLEQVARAHPNVVVADWKSFSAGHPDWFKDGLHLTAKGMSSYALFVRRAMLGV